MLVGTLGTDIAYTSYSQVDTSWHDYCYACARIIKGKQSIVGMIVAR